MTRPRKSTMIRNARKATAARKRAAFDFQTPNKKPLTCAKGYAFDATGAPNPRPGSQPNAPQNGALSRGIGR